MRTRTAVLALAFLLTGVSPTRALDRARLREAGRLPLVTARAGIGFNSLGEFILQGERADPAQITVLEKAMKGDASDAERHYRLGQLTDGDKSERAFAKAVSLFREQVKANPKDAWVLAQLGQALAAAGQMKEADKVLRQAVALAPRDWRCRVALGRYLQGRVEDLLFQSIPSGRKGGATFDQLLACLADKKVEPRALARALKGLNEAANCFDRAVAAAPAQPEVYRKRALLRAMEGLVRSASDLPRAEGANLWVGLCNKRMIADLKQAGRLDPNDVRSIAMAAFSEVMAAVSAGALDANAQGLPGRLERSLREAASKLETGARSKDRHVAADSSELLGFLYGFLLQDLKRAETAYRRAIVLRPDREPAWDMLEVVLVGQGRNQELVTLLTRRLEHKDTARNRFLLAKAYERLNQAARAEEHVRAALKLKPTDRNANLALAVLLVKRAEDPAALKKAKQQLDRAGTLLKSKATSNQQSCFQLTHGIYLGLSGNARQAKECFRALLDREKNNEAAQAALDALER